MTLGDKIFEVISLLKDIIRENDNAANFREEMIEVLATLKKSLFIIDGADRAVPDDSLFYREAKKDFGRLRAGHFC